MKALSVDILRENMEAAAEADGAVEEEVWGARHEIDTANNRLSAAMDVDDDDDKLGAAVGKEVSTQLTRRTAQAKSKARKKSSGVPKEPGTTPVRSGQSGRAATGESPAPSQQNLSARPTNASAPRPQGRGHGRGGGGRQQQQQQQQMQQQPQQPRARGRERERKRGAKGYDLGYDGYTNPESYENQGRRRSRSKTKYELEAGGDGGESTPQQQPQTFAFGSSTTTIMPQPPPILRNPNQVHWKGEPAAGYHMGQQPMYQQPYYAPVPYSHPNAHYPATYAQLPPAQPSNGQPRSNPDGGRGAHRGGRGGRHSAGRNNAGGGRWLGRKGKF